MYYSLLAVTVTNTMRTAVRVGDLAMFQDTVAKYEAKFRLDRTYTLIQRYVLFYRNEVLATLTNFFILQIATKRN